MCTQCRMTVTISHELKRRLEEIKKAYYWDRPYSEMYRDLIRLGLECANDGRNE